MRENKIKQLSDVDHVLKRPGMYVGATNAEILDDRWQLNPLTGMFERGKETTIQGLMKLFSEIISNSIDEAYRCDFKAANQISVIVYDAPMKGFIRVEDNGRGIPLRPSPDHKGMTEAEVAVSALRAGGNFDDSVEDAVAIGTHGLGATLVNILSDSFHLETSDGSNVLSAAWEKNMSKQVQRDFTRSKKTGTAITWKFSEKVFPDGMRLWPDIQRRIRKYMMDLSVCFPKIHFTLNDEWIQVSKFEDYVACYSNEKGQILDTKDFSLAVLPWEGGAHATFVNGIDTYEGGTHLEVIQDALVDGILDELGREAKKLDLKPRDILNNILIVAVIRHLPKPKFRSQTKEYITNPKAEILEAIGEIPKRFIKAVARDPNITIPIMEFKRIRLHQREAAEAAKKARALKSLSVDEHIPANGKPEDCILHLTEGRSASGMLGQVRDPMIHGSYPLRGKPMNVWGLKPIEILSNKELSEVMSILGLKFGDDENTPLNYGKVRIVADADHDGHHIVSLLLAFFSHWPWLFEQGRISIVRCPIQSFRLRSGRTLWAYSFAEAEEIATKRKADITSSKYYKGLGALSEEEYSDMIHNPHEDVIRNIRAEDQRALELAFGEDADARKIWLTKEKTD